MSTNAPALRGIHQRLAFPPPPPRPTLEVLRHLDGIDDDLAAALFFILRRICDLVEAPPCGTLPWKRAEYARTAAANAPEIASDLLLLGNPRLLLTAGNRGKAAAACHRLADWAAKKRFPDLALHYAALAASLEPDDASRTYEAARIHRLFSRKDDAEVLYSRAICLARPGKHWPVYIRSHLGLGHIYIDRDDMGRAAAHMTTAASRARHKAGQKWLSALIEHDLFMLAVENLDFNSAHEHARRACESMPVHDESVPALVHDYAYLLLLLQTPKEALFLLERLVEKRLPSTAMLLVWSTLARAAAMIGARDRFLAASVEAQALVSRFGLHAAAAYANLGIGADTLGFSTEAESYLKTSLELARSNSEERIIAEAEELLKNIGRKKSGPRPAVIGAPEHMTRLVSILADRVAKWRGPHWKRKQQSGRGQLGVV